MSSFDAIENNWLAAPDREVEAMSRCYVCAAPICRGDSYWETAVGDICSECLEGMTAAAFLRDVCCEKENTAKID